MCHIILNPVNADFYIRTEAFEMVKSEKKLLWDPFDKEENKTNMRGKII